jgi:hypothetical protein
MAHVFGECVLEPITHIARVHMGHKGIAQQVVVDPPPGLTLKHPLHQLGPAGRGEGPTRAIHKHVAVCGERGRDGDRRRTLGGAQQSRTAFTKVLDERLNEERVEFGDHGAVLGVGFVLYNDIISIERNIERRLSEYRKVAYSIAWSEPTPTATIQHTVNHPLFD